MDPFQKKFSVEDIPDLSGKVVIVTGGATGIGKQTVEQLLKHKAKVYVASRSKAKYDLLLSHLESTELGLSAGLNYLKLDLSDATSCVTAARHFAEVEERLDVLIANAALSVVPDTLSSDGVEVQFGTNYFGHFVFIRNLLDLIKSTSKAFGEARIVIVSSHAHAMYKPVLPDMIDFEGLRIEGSNTLNSIAEVQASLQRYARSKLANILFARRLHSYFQTTGYSNILVNCLNPGTVGAAPGTESVALPPIFKFINSSIIRFVGISPEDGALTTLLLATDPEISAKSLSGRYFDIGPLAGKFYYGYSWDATDSKLSDLAKDEDLSEKLWNWSVQAETMLNVTS